LTPTFEIVVARCNSQQYRISIASAPEEQFGPLSQSNQKIEVMFLLPTRVESNVSAWYVTSCSDSQCYRLHLPKVAYH